MDKIIDPKELQRLASRLVKEAVQMALSLQSQQTVVKQKDIADIATSSDIACEEFIISEIKKSYPDHAIYAEESGQTDGHSDYTWIVDPIDGTKEYARGGKDFNCLIAVERNGEIVAGSSYRAGSGYHFSASKGNGAFLNEKTITVSLINNLGAALVGLYISEEKIDLQMELIKKLINSCYRLRPGWDNGFLLASSAAGFMDGYIMFPGIAKWYDVAPGILFVKEARGKITDFLGDEIKDRDLSKGILASNGKIHDKLLEIVSSYSDN